MKLLNAYTVPYPPDMNLISEPGVPKAVHLTLQFEGKSTGIILDHGSTVRHIAQQMRQFADQLEEL